MRGDDSVESPWNKLEKPNGEEAEFSASMLAIDSYFAISNRFVYNLKLNNPYRLLDCVVLQSELLDLICNPYSVTDFLDTNLFQHGLIQLHQVLSIDVVHYERQNGRIWVTQCSRIYL